MWRALLLFIPLLLGAANFRLYLKDGGWHMVSEYKVLEDRVKFYSTERGDWEEMPLDLVDLKKTESEIQKIADTRKKEARLIDEEEKAEREAARELSLVPQDTGVFYVDGKEIKPLKVADIKVVTDKKRSVWKAITPIPIVAGKATVELDGETSQFAVNSAEPEFYFRLSKEQRFGIFKLTPGKNTRIVEKISIIPVSKEMVEEPIPVEIFRRQVGEGLYKIWPMKPLEPGEYAAVEYTDGAVNLQVWDFSVKAK